MRRLQILVLLFIIISNFKVQAKENVKSSEFYAGNNVKKHLILFTYLTNSSISEINTDLHKPDTIKLNDQITRNNISLLSSGLWVKFACTREDIYAIPFSKLSQLGFNSPNHVQVYGLNYGLLSKYVSSTTQSDLQAIPILHYSEKIIAYLHGPSFWDFNDQTQDYYFNKNQYADTAWYFLHEEEEEFVTEIVMAEQDTGTASQSYNWGDTLIYHEHELTNLLKSGREWYGEEIGEEEALSIPFQLPDALVPDSCELTLSAIARSKATASENLLSVKLNDSELLSSLTFPPVIDNLTTEYAKTETQTIDFILPVKNFTIDLSFKKANQESFALLDYLSIQARQKLIYRQNNLLISNKEALGKICTFSIQQVNDSGLVLFDISKPSSPIMIPYLHNNNTIQFTVNYNSFRKFILFDPERQHSEPLAYRVVKNQNLHSMDQIDYLIITAPEFRSEANDLANYHRSKGLIVKLVYPDEIYNEFSGGICDVAAIRNFIQNVYLLGNKQLKFVLFFGDGSYDMRPEHFNKQTNLLNYQSQNSLVPVLSFVSDDFFGLLDEGEGEQSGFLDIGLGRLPVNNKAQARCLVDKIIAYQENSLFTAWRQHILFIADDEDSNIHLQQANLLANETDANHPEYIVHKVFLDAFPEQQTVYGTTYPEAELQIKELVNDGLLIFNYTGHGGPFGLSSERVVNTDNIADWENETMNTIFVTATCEFSQFDDPELTSAGELLLLNEKKGAAALFSTTRKVFSTPNFILNQQFYKYVFADTIEYLGDIIKWSKIGAGAGQNKRYFALLGDPASRILKPRYDVQTKMINSMSVDSFASPIGKADFISLEGGIYSDSLIVNDFNGWIEICLYGQKQKQSTLGNPGNTKTTFMQTGSPMLKNSAFVVDGKWNLSFFIPVDLPQEQGIGKFTFYAHRDSEQADDAAGAFVINKLGGEGSMITDFSGPEISAIINGIKYNPGMKILNPCKLELFFSDSSGINTNDYILGHQIRLQKDAEESQNITKHFMPVPGDFTTGTIEYQFTGMESGLHKIQVSAYDRMNNQSVKDFYFEIDDSLQPTFISCRVSPNPSSNEVHFLIESEGNPIQAVHLFIYDIQGKLVFSDSFQEVEIKEGKIHLSWSGQSFQGKKTMSGILLYKLEITGNFNDTEIISGKIIRTP